jgi:phospholipid/cholesterol/gamma-HCH transport system permease protein
MDARMRALADFTTEAGADGGVRLAFTVPMRVSSLGSLDKRLRALDGPIREIDLAGVEEIDTVGAWTAWRVARDHEATIVNARAEARRLIAAVKAAENTAPIRAPRSAPSQRILEAVGLLVSGWGSGAKGVISFLGALLLAALAVIRHPHRFRGKALVHQMELVGVSSLGIIGLMSFLIGIVVAQQGAVQLRQFGAEIYTVNLVGRLCLRELGVLMTAIMVAGRSGSAFAAQIGTMKLTEEVDAMRTIGVSPIEALVLPRILAAILMMPLLGIFSAVTAIIGGAFLASLTLGIGFVPFLARIQEVVPIYDLWVCLVKAPVFGLIVALTGCYQGMQVKSNSEEVGLRTTAAVVMAIFMVIVLDAFFAVFFTNVGWA